MPTPTQTSTETSTPATPPSSTQRLQALYTGVLFDVMRGMGHQDFVLPPSIRPLNEGPKLAGPIFTVEGQTGENFDAHETLLGWTGLLSKAPGGHVVVCQPHNDQIALMGELSAETLKMKGVLGYLVDGGTRDCQFILDMDFPVWCRFRSPRDIVGKWLPKAFNEPISIGGVRIRGGDYLLADRDGVVIIPGDKVETIVNEAERALGVENKVRTEILAGMDPQQAYLKFGKF